LKKPRQKNIHNLLKETEDRFRKINIALPGLDAEILLSFYLKKDRSTLYTNREYIPTDKEMREYENGVARRLRGEPVAYITGRKEFWSLDLEINDKVLIPRPETEILVEQVLRLVKKWKLVNGKILEIGTGSGAISIALASELEKARFFAIDISIDAVKIAKRNAGRNGVEKLVSFVCGNLFEPFSEKFDFIISNPPYISEKEFQCLPAEVRNFEPEEALLAGPKGIEFHRELVKKGADYLKRKGWLVMEIGYGQSHAVERILKETQKYDLMRFRTDYAGIKRVAEAQRKG